MEHLGEFFGTNNGTYTYAFLPSLEAFDEKAKPGISQPPFREGKPKLEDVKPLYFQPSDCSDWGAGAKGQTEFCQLSKTNRGCFAKRLQTLRSSGCSGQVY